MVFEHLHYEYPTLHHTLVNCMLVCKSWNRLFQKALYTNVLLMEYQNAHDLSKILGKAPHLGSLIKKLKINFEIDLKDRLDRVLMNKLFARLPNLESINCSFGQYCSFLLDAMILGHLPKLKHIEPEKYKREMRDYTSCALMLKDRLTYLCIADNEHEYQKSKHNVDNVSEDSDDGVFEDSDDDVATLMRGKNSIVFNRLFSKLNRFKNIQQLYIKKKSENIIELIEVVTQNSPSLKQLEISFTFEFDEKYLYYILEDFNKSCIEKSLPATKVKILVLDKNACSNNPQLIQYIMQKFPQLEYLEFHGTANYDNDEITFKKLLKYLLNIKVVKAPHISCKGQTLTNSIKSCWNITDPLHEFVVHIYLNHSARNTNENRVTMKNRPYLKSIGDSPFETGIEIIKNYGQYIHDLSLIGANDSYNVLQSLKDCVRLQELVMKSWLFTESNISGYEKYKKQTFDSLTLIDCFLQNDNIFKGLSKLFARLNYLYLGGIRYNAYYGNSPYENINMENTDIGILLLDKGGYYMEDFIHQEPVVLVRLSIKEREDYYIYDFDTMGDFKFKPIDEERFHNESEQDHRLIFGIKCKSLGILNVDHRNEIVRLTVT